MNRPSRIKKVVEELGINLQNHQIKFLSGFIHNGVQGAIAIHGTGTGKTLMAITAAIYYLKAHPNNKVYIITPKSIGPNFQKEKNKLIERGHSEKIANKITLLTYEQYYKERHKCNNSLVIVDESHRLRTEGDEVNSKGIDILRNVCTKSSTAKVLLLTATPLVNTPNDINNLISIINKTEPYPKAEFEKLIDDPKFLKETFKCKLDFFEHPPNLKKKFFPREYWNVAILKMNPDYLKKYYKIEQGKKIPSIKSDKNLTSFFNGVRRASFYIEGMNSRKFKMVVDIYNSINQRKMVIYSNFREFGSDALSKYLTNKRISHAVIDGSSTIKRRDDVVINYNNDIIKILIITKAGSEGLDLKRTGAVVFLDIPWNWASVEQIVGRGVRYKSHEDLPEKDRIVHVWFILELKPIEVKLFNENKEYIEKILKRVSNHKMIDEAKNKILEPRENVKESEQKPSIDYYFYFYIRLKQLKLDLFKKKLKSIRGIYNCWSQNRL